MSPRRAARETCGPDDVASVTADVRFERDAGRVFDVAGALREEVVFFDKN